MILSTHILQEVAQICQKVVIINEGRIVVEDQIANLTREHDARRGLHALHQRRDAAAEEAPA